MGFRVPQDARGGRQVADRGADASILEDPQAPFEVLDVRGGRGQPALAGVVPAGQVAPRADDLD